MRLTTTRAKTPHPVMGIQAVVVKDDVNGGALVIQQDKEQMIIKLSDLVEFINKQDAEAQKVLDDLNALVKPESDGVNE